jgi:hypothetical protein
MQQQFEHPLDGDLLVARDAEAAGESHPALSHLRTCEACRDRVARLQTLLAEGLDAMEAPGSDAWEEQRSRARLAQALSEASHDLKSSWTFRLRNATRALRPGLAVPVAAALVGIAVWAGGHSPALRAAPEVAAVRGHVLPIASLTPGAVTPLTTEELCSGRSPSRRVTEEVRRAVVRSYGMEGVPESDYELDALVTPELGGSTDPRNLWPQPYTSPVWNARVKDRIEDLLPRLVCAGTVDLARAQQDIARDWIAAYKKYFRTDVPLQAHVTGAEPRDGDELEIVPAVDPPRLAAALRLARY